MSTTDQSVKHTPDLGAERTVMAADRTLMAWIRTALSMFSFGFTIYKLLETMADSGSLTRSNSPQFVGLVLAGLGVLAIGLGMLEFWLTVRQLESFRIFRPALVIAGVMLVCGVMLFAGIATRIV